MNRRARIYYADSQRAVMWDRWKGGWTLHQIGDCLIGRVRDVV
jgi:hypothetical protein